MSDDKKPEDNKVVPFPSHKIKKPKIGSKPTFGQPNGQNRRVTLFISLISTLLVATFMASRMNLNDLNSRGFADRQVASDSSVSRRDLDEDLLLAKKIARESLREPASRGREPTAEDLLRHGELAGFYALNFDDNGALKGLEFSGQPGEERYLKDREPFIKKHQDLFRIDFDQIERTDSIQDKEFRFEVYELRQGDKVKARVHYKVDDKDRLYSMKVESI